MNVRSKFRTFVVSFAILFLPLLSSAQNEEDTKAELTAFLSDFAEAYVNLPETKEVDSVLQYFAQDARSNLFTFGISGRFKVQNTDQGGFESFLKNIIRSEGISIGYEIGDIYFTHVSPELATLAYTVAYETKEEDGLWVKGNETVTMALEKRKKNWQIVHYTIMQIEDEKLKGTCLCELFLSEGESGAVVAKTTIPTGRSYATKFNNFEFKKTGQNQVITTGETAYMHLSSGEVTVLGEDEETAIGISSSKRETVLTILEEHLYKDQCSSLRAKGKR